nr:proteasome accessory factor PafA2 family protein [Nocardioides convexus]
MEKRGAVARVTKDLTIFEAKSVPPQNTRARLRGEFIRKAQERRRDFTVDWVHLKAQRPGPAHGALQGPLPGVRRAGAAPHRRHVIDK